MQNTNRKDLDQIVQSHSLARKFFYIHRNSVKVLRHLLCEVIKVLIRLNGCKMVG